MVDVVPTILRFLHVAVPDDLLFELDGIPLSGKATHVFKSAEIKDNNLLLKWEALANEGMLKIWISTTNNFPGGEKDEYISLADVRISEQHAILDISKYPSDYYKIVLQSDEHATNKWIVRNMKYNN